MTRTGQCPDCRTVYELDDDDVGRVLECECSATLFVADIAGFNEIPVCCPQCDGEYVVDRDGAGETVECECGLQLTVPDVVLRTPMVSRDDNASKTQDDGVSETQDDDAEETDSAAELNQGEQLVDCPRCDNRFVVTGDDLRIESECECGCIFTAEMDDQGQIIAVESTAKVRTPPTKKPPSESKKESPERSSERPSRKRSSFPGGKLVMAAIALLFLFSITMFVLRRTGRLDRSDPKPTAAKSTSPPPPIQAEAIVIAPIDVTEDPDVPADQMTGPLADPDPTIAATSVGITSPASSQTAKLRSPGNAEFAFAPPTRKELPKPKPARPIVPITMAKNSGATFERAFQEAFAEYETTNELQAAAKESGDNAEYHTQLGKTIGLLQQTLAIGSRRQSDSTQLNEVRFLMTYLLYQAGRLGEASVMAEVVARIGKRSEPSSKEALMIGLAATQEANQTHWASAEEVGELDQMRRLVDILAKKWPKDPQLDAIRMNLAQTYDRFNHPLKAAAIYRQIPDGSPNFAAARLAGGSALWAEYRFAAADDSAKTNVSRNNRIREQARELLTSGIEQSVKADPKPRQAILVAKLSLARIQLSEGKLAEAEKTLTEPPMSITESITATKPSESQIKVSAGFVRLVFETLFSIRTQLGNSTGANKALTQLSSRLSPKDSAEIGKLYLTVATDYIDKIQSNPIVTRKQCSTLAKLIEPLKGQGSALTASNVLWLGESWSKLAAKAENEAVSQLCFEKAAAAYALAMSREDFPKSNRQGALLRRSQLLRSANQVGESAKLIAELLAKTPNAFGLQIEAVEALQAEAIGKNQPLSLVDAVNGPPNSPIWGWNKLVTTLHASNSRSGADAKTAERLMKSKYNLAKCQWLIARATTDPNQKAQRMADLNKLLRRLATTIPPDAKPWAKNFNDLIREIAAES